jgi:hypothetical protein
MDGKDTKLDETTVAIAKRLMEMPPKPHDEMRVGRPSPKKARGSKGRASSSTP